uniref:Uncharacterized protein n=1 Tax=Oryza glumipatula TaxID=40148 RepID=A0A0E0AHF9_9ORYZ
MAMPSLPCSPSISVLSCPRWSIWMYTLVHRHGRGSGASAATQADGRMELDVSVGTGKKIMRNT